jgi:hypothetical protein
MARGKIIPITPHEAIMRALDTVALPRSRYKLGAGGKDPESKTPFTELDGVIGSDCVGFVLWCLGVDRFQEKLFSTFGGWINTDSIMQDAAGKKEFFEFVSQPQPGDLVVFPSIYVNGKRKRIGHVGIVSSVAIDVSDWTAALWNRPKDQRGRFLKHVRVIDCAGALTRKLAGKAVQLTTAAASWNKQDARFVRYRRFASDSISGLLVNGKRVA